MKEDSPLGPEHVTDVYGLLDCRVAVLLGFGPLGAHVLGIMEQELDATYQRFQGSIVPAWDVGVVRDVCDVGGPVGNPISEGPPSFVDHFAGHDLETADLDSTFIDGAEGPVALKLIRRHREVRRSYRLRKQRQGVGHLFGNQKLDCRGRVVQRWREWQSVCVVPMQVGEENGPVERMGRAAQPLEARSGIEQQCWFGSVVG